MGCGASADRRKLGNRTKKTEEPELNGKVKFLACPSVGEIKHPDSGNKWFVIVFAPQTHHGMVMAARDMRTGKILCKELRDPQIVVEKEAQKITMSWNLFFKAIAAEISKVGKSGAKFEFVGEDLLRLEIKIAITGQAANSRKPDLYKCDLTPLETNGENVFRLFVEPIATFYGKKRTDLLDRPDPQKERNYGECEANSIVKVASIAESERVIKTHLPSLQPLRDKLTAARRDCLTQTSRAELMRHMLAEGTLTPSVVKAGADDNVETLLVGCGIPFPPTRLAEPDLVASQELEAWRPDFDAIRANVTESAVDSGAPASWSGERESLRILANLASSNAFDDAVECATQLHAKTNGCALALISYYLLYRYDVLKKAPEIDDERLRAALLAIQKSHSVSNPFHNSHRSARVVAALSFMLKVSNFVVKARMTPLDIFALVIAACAHDIHHPGVNNQHLKYLRSRVNAVYCSDSTLERYQAAATVQLLHKYRLPRDEIVVADIAALTVATDLQNHTEITTQFMHRCLEVSDFGRTHADRMLAAAVLLKLADIHHVALGAAASTKWWALNSEEFEAQAKLEATYGIVVPDVRRVSKVSPQQQRMFAAHVAAPLAKSVAGAFPGMTFFSQVCAA